MRVRMRADKTQIDLGSTRPGAVAVSSPFGRGRCDHVRRKKKQRNVTVNALTKISPSDRFWTSTNITACTCSTT